MCHNCVNDFAGDILDFMVDLYDGGGCKEENDMSLIAGINLVSVFHL